MSYINIDGGADKELTQRLLDTNFAGTVLAGTPETDEDYASGIVVTDAAGQKFTATDLPTANEEATDGSITVKSYDLDGVTVFVEIGGPQDGLHIFPAGAKIVVLISEFERGDLSMAEHLASWGFDGTPDEVTDETATDVRIWCEPNYYAGTLGAPIGHYVCDEDTYDRDAFVFATYADAQEWIDAEEDGIYCTAHGEAGRPTYTICE